MADDEIPAPSELTPDRWLSCQTFHRSGFAHPSINLLNERAFPVSTEHHNDEQPVSLLAAVLALYDTMPAFTAPATERAAWFDAKAAVFDRMATSTDPVGGDSYKATAARQTANTIREQEDQR